MIYPLLRGVAGLALRWYYRDIEVSGLDRVPQRGPVLLVVNHPNALVDALVVGWILPRRIRITAKSSLFENPLAARFLAWVGVTPLHRSTDERPGRGKAARTRNVDAFRAIVAAFRRGSAVLIFPEGTTHDNPSINPLRSGTARLALYARDQGVRDLVVVPIGLIFDRKDEPRSRVLAQVGEPLVLEFWTPSEPGREVRALTSEIDARLRAVTLNYETMGEAERTAALAATIARLLIPQSKAVGLAGPSLADEAVVARRIEELRKELATGDPRLRARGLSIAAAADRVRTELQRERIRLDDVDISLGTGAGMRFVLREAWIAAIAGPIAVWGEINHLIPFQGARAIAQRSVESAADPAMRTIVAGAALVLLGYLAQGLAVGVFFGPRWALVYLVSLPISADVSFRLRDRLRRIARRARTYLRFRRHPELQAELLVQLGQLRSDALAFDALAREHRNDSPR